MSGVLPLTDSACGERQLSGGKGANLAQMIRAGFPVPPGFCVTTDGYTEFVEQAGIRDRVAAITATIDVGGDISDLEAPTKEIRALILEAVIPAALVAAIAEAYRGLGDSVHVAVRSSGTAEDLENASFAGQHDTYLDVCGPDAVVAAVQRCWASLFTPRATDYRNQIGVGNDPSVIGMAVVVQTMVASEVSGVMFTANPVNTATDEVAINASWGLGELIVQGTVTPDEFVVRSGTQRILDRTLGAKEHRMDREVGAAGGGSVITEVPAADRDRATLTDAQVAELAAIGLRVQEHYRGWPQDIEWALAGGRFYVLQARPITGVEFSWDADVEIGHGLPEDDDAVWSHCWSDSLTNGVVTPLMFSARFVPFSDTCYPTMAKLFGFDDLAQLRTFKFWKGNVYYNLAFEREYVQRTVWPAMRMQAMEWIPAPWRAELMSAPFSPLTYIKAIARLQLLAPHRAPFGFFKTMEKWRARPEVDGKTAQELATLSDSAVIAYTEEMIELERAWADEIWTWSFYNFREGMFVLYWMLDTWCDVDSPSVFGTLLGGTIERTDTMREGDAVRNLAETVRASEQLSRIFEEHEGAAAFAACAGVPEGGAFLVQYERFLGDYGHRGHADRDIYYLRHRDDQGVTYRAIKMLLGSEPVDAHAQEAAVRARREQALDEVLAQLRKRPFGGLRAELFKVVFEFVHRNLLIRDNERWRPTDPITYAYKKGFVEIGRRLHERGLIDHERDFFFFGKEELYDLFQGRVENHELLKAKIAGRARDGDRVLAREDNHPGLLQRNRPLILEDVAEHGTDGVFRGHPTSSGTITGTARVMKALEQISTLKRGEILVVNATDPGWNPVFHVVAGIVVETGGNLSHASCMAREFGLPAVQLPGALRLIPEGATVQVDGNTGRVTILEQPDTEPIEPAAVSA